MESFRGFVVDVICIFKFNNFVIIIVECLKVFEQVFGSVESFRDVQIKFLNIYQNLGEKLFVYVICLEFLLQKVVEKGVIDKDNVNQVCLEQVIVGVNYSGVI